MGKQIVSGVHSCVTCVVKINIQGTKYSKHNVPTHMEYIWMNFIIH
jgi:hypothetical protein